MSSYQCVICGAAATLHCSDCYGLDPLAGPGEPCVSYCSTRHQAEHWWWPRRIVEQSSSPQQQFVAMPASGGGGGDDGDDDGGERAMVRSDDGVTPIPYCPHWQRCLGHRRGHAPAVPTRGVRLAFDLLPVDPVLNVVEHLSWHDVGELRRRFVAEQAARGGGFSAVRAAVDLRAMALYRRYVSSALATTALVLTRVQSLPYWERMGAQLATAAPHSVRHAREAIESPSCDDWYPLYEAAHAALNSVCFGQPQPARRGAATIDLGKPHLLAGPAREADARRRREYNQPLAAYERYFEQAGTPPVYDRAFFDADDVWIVDGGTAMVRRTVQLYRFFEGLHVLLPPRSVQPSFPRYLLDMPVLDTLTLTERSNVIGHRWDGGGDDDDDDDDDDFAAERRINVRAERQRSADMLRDISEWIAEFARRPQRFTLRKLHAVDLGIGAVGEHLGALEALIELDLSQNALRTLPVSLQRLTRLVSLDLSENRLTELDERSFAGPIAQQLLGLRLSKNRELRRLPASLGALEELRELRVDECAALEALPSPSALGWQRLSTLDASGTALRTLPDELGPTAHSLRVLRLDRCTQLQRLPASLAKAAVDREQRQRLPRPLTISLANTPSLYYVPDTLLSPEIRLHDLDWVAINDARVAAGVHDARVAAGTIDAQGQWLFDDTRPFRRASSMEQ